MYLYIKDKEGLEVGHIEVNDNEVAHCYSRCFEYLGKMVEKGKHIFVFDDKENFIGRYDGKYSYDKFNNRIGTGNYTYEFFYPSIDEIDFGKETDLELIIGETNHKYFFGEEMEKFNFNIKSVIDCLVPSTVTMITGGPGTGKTMLALNIATQYGVNENKTVAYFSLEQSAKEIVIKIVSMLANVSTEDIRGKKLNQNDLKRLELTNEELQKSKIYIDDTVMTITLQKMENKIERLVTKHKCIDLIIVDYLQLLPFSCKEVEAIETVNRLKVIAKKFNVPIILLSQMGRDGKGGWKNTYPSSIADTCISLVQTYSSNTWQREDFYMTFDYGKYEGRKILLDCDFNRVRIFEKI